MHNRGAAHRAAEPVGPRLAFVTIGQAPRDDVVPELLALLDLAKDDVAAADEFGALDGLEAEAIAAHPPAQNERGFYTRLTDGSHVVIGAGFVGRRLDALLKRVDAHGYDLIVLISTGVFRPLRLRTRLVHGQQVMDAWIAALVMGDCELGVIYPLPQQHRAFAHGTLVQNSRVVVATGDAAMLEDAALRLGQAELILMHSVGYTEAMAQHIASITRKPVVTARRIIAGAMRLHLAELSGRAGAAPEVATSADALPADLQGAAVLDRLSNPADPLTPRERDVVGGVLGGESNKAIGRRLGISHRTVEIHRGRALAKLDARSAADLIRKLLIARLD
jgi:protein AroM